MEEQPIFSRTQEYLSSTNEGTLTKYTDPLTNIKTSPNSQKHVGNKPVTPFFTKETGDFENDEAMLSSIEKKTVTETHVMRRSSSRIHSEPGITVSKTADSKQRKYFLIHNSWSNKVMDVRQDDTRPGAYLIIYTLKTPLSDNQLWYMDQKGYICSKLTGFYIDTSSDGYARLERRGEANIKQHWIYYEDDRSIRNGHDKNKVLEIRWGINFKCNKVVEHDYNGRKNQRWELRYVDM